MKKIAWTKFKIGPPPSDSVDLLDDEDEEDDDDTPWAKKEKGKYGVTTDRLEEIISKGRVIQTPLGAINADGSEESHKLFNVWAGHVNFILRSQHFALIERVPGVEALQPISQYRFQIAIGFMFDEDEVKKTISDVLVGSSKSDAIELLKIFQFANVTLPTKIAQKLENTVKDITKQWAAFVHPNGEIKMIVADRIDDDFMEELSILGLAQSLYTGYIDSSLLRPSG